MKGYKGADGIIPFKVYLESLDMLLTEDASQWAESHSNVVRLLIENEPTQATVDSFKSLLCERFSTKVIEVTFIPFDIELSELHQKLDKPLSICYKRV